MPWRRKAPPPVVVACVADTDGATRRLHVAACGELQLDLTQQLEDVLVRLPFPSHAPTPSLGYRSGPVLGGKDNERGKVSIVPKFLSLPSSIRLLVRTVQRYRPDYEVDFADAGWAGLKQAIQVRNRLVHPKTMEDLEVSDDDLQRASAGFHWILALEIEVMEEPVDFKDAQRLRMEKELQTRPKRD